jgi:hypothetical protein
MFGIDNTYAHTPEAEKALSALASVAITEYAERAIRAIPGSLC